MRSRLLVFLLLPQPLFAAVGNVLSVKGLPSLQVKADGSQRGLGPGHEVDAGDVVSTDQQSTAKIHLIDETILDVNQSSRVTMPRLLAPDSRERMVLIQVERGKVRAKVNREIERAKGRFEIQSYAAYLGVEGTDFVVEVFPPDENGITRTTVSVLEGQVNVRGANERDNPAAAGITLTAGMRFTAVAKVIGENIQQDAFKPEDIQRLEQSVLDELVRNSKLNNETFLQSISLASGPGNFGFSTLQAVNRNVQSDKGASVQTDGRGEALFRKRFRDDQFSNFSNFVNLTIGFP